MQGRTCAPGTDVSWCYEPLGGFFRDSVVDTFEAYIFFTGRSWAALISALCDSGRTGETGIEQYLGRVRLGVRERLLTTGWWAWNRPPGAVITAPSCWSSRGIWSSLSDTGFPTPPGPRLLSSRPLPRMVLRLCVSLCYAAFASLRGAVFPSSGAWALQKSAAACKLPYSAGMAGVMAFRAHRTHLCFSDRSEKVAACLQMNNSDFTAKIFLCASLDSQGTSLWSTLDVASNMWICCPFWTNNSIAWWSALEIWTQWSLWVSAKWRYSVLL